MGPVVRVPPKPSGVVEYVPFGVVVRKPPKPLGVAVEVPEGPLQRTPPKPFGEHVVACAIVDPGVAVTNRTAAIIEIFIAPPDLEYHQYCRMFGKATLVRTTTEITCLERARRMAAFQFAPSRVTNRGT